MKNDNSWPDPNIIPATVAYPIGYILSQAYSINPGKIENTIIPNKPVQIQYKAINFVFSAIAKRPKTTKVMIY